MNTTPKTEKPIPWVSINSLILPRMNLHQSTLEPKPTSLLLNQKKYTKTSYSKLLVMLTGFHPEKYKKLKIRDHVDLAGLSHLPLPLNLLKESKKDLLVTSLNKNL